MYFNINLPKNETMDRARDIIPLTFGFVYTVLPLLLLTMVEISARLQNRKTNDKIFYWGFWGCIVVGIIVYLTSDLFMGDAGLRNYLIYYENFGIVLLLWEMVILIRLYYFSTKKEKNISVIKSFSVLYLLRYPLIMLLFLIPNPYRSFGAILLINIAPFIWIKYFVDKTESKSLPEGSKTKIEILAQKNGLSKREVEILSFIIQGKTNKEIHEELFLSYHTVKNHVYNIFQKMNVSSRYQLISLNNE